MPTHNTDIKKIKQVLTRGVAEILPNRDKLAKLMAEKPIRLYLGIDPTGAFLHLGHSVVLRKLQQFAELGHEVILLIGNGTVKIGDPTGKDASRPMLADEQIENNFKSWKRQASKILDFTKIKIKRNGDWLDKLTMPEIIKLAAKTTVQQLIERDMFQQRFKKGLPIHGHEILYPLLQGYDSVAMNVDLEVGGTDQIFNMMMGRTLQKIYNNHEKWVLATPIINGTDGKKMSKSFNNFIALEDEPKQMYGKLMSIADVLIIEYFTLLTDMTDEKIQAMQQAMSGGTNPIKFKKQLAFAITANLHNKEAANQAQEHFERTIQAGELPQTMPVINIKQNKIKLIDLLKACESQISSNQLKRLVEQGAVSLLPEGKKPTDPFSMIDIKNDQVIKIGKRKYFKIKIG